MSLPKCKLCRHPAWCVSDNDVGATQCSNDACALHYCFMDAAQWRALMAPPQVTDEMVDAGHAVMLYAQDWLNVRGMVRQILEAALNPKEAPDAP